MSSHWPKASSRARHPLGGLIVIAMAVLSLAALVEHYDGGDPTLASTPTRERAGRLVVFWIDSLAVSDVESGGHLPRLRERLPRALHGRVRECLDAVSVPCFLAMTSGQDRFSLLSLGSNFAGTTPLGESNVLAQARRRGLRVGYAGDPLVAPALGDLDWVATFEKPDDHATFAEAMRALSEARLDVLVVHVREPDSVSHRQGPASDAYADALERADTLVADAWSTLSSDDHVAVVGDHGHDAKGRHLAGLDVPTYAVYAGPRFDRPLVRAMAITDHARIWAHLLGVAAPAVPWVDAYFEGRAVESTWRLPAARLVTRALPAALVGLGMLLATGLGAYLARRWLPRRFEAAGLGLAVVGLVAMFALGFHFADYRDRIYAPGHVYGALGSLLLGAPLAALGVWLARRIPGAGREVRALDLWVLGGVLFALPTVYRIGGFVAGTSAFLLFSLWMCFDSLWRRRARRALAFLALFVLFATFWVSLVVNFKLQYFVVYARFMREHLAEVTLLLSGAAAAVVGFGSGRRARLGGSLAAGVILATIAASAPLPETAFVLPTLTTPVLVVAALHRPALTPAAFLVAPTGLAYFVEYDLVRLAPIVAALLCFALWSVAMEPA